MYEDSWYSYVPTSRSKNDDSSSHPSKHRRRESLLKQPNVSLSTFTGKEWPDILQGSNQISDPSDPIMELFEDPTRLIGPPKATLTRRAKSYSYFYEAATTGSLSQDTWEKKPHDIFDTAENAYGRISLGDRFEEYENDLLDASNEEYQWVAQHVSFGPTLTPKKTL